MSLANFIISAASLILLLGYGTAAAWMSRRTTVMPQLPDWPDNEPDEAAELIAAWRNNIEKGQP